MAEAYGTTTGLEDGRRLARGHAAVWPMISAWIADGGVLDDARHRCAALRLRFRFLIGKDLPPRATPYTREEIVAAIASCHPAIEELEAGLTEPVKVHEIHHVRAICRCMADLSTARPLQIGID